MVNVIIPVYNNSDVLRDALRSLENQTKKMFITTVVDDCSTEDIKAVCDEFKNTLKIIYHRQEENKGPGFARQAGLNIAVSKNFEYVIFLDSDDILYPRAVETLSREISRSKADLIVSPIQCEKKHDPGKIIEPRKSVTWLHGKIYRVASLVENNIRFSKKIRYNEDAAFNTLTFNLLDNIAYIEEVVYLWRDYSDSITRSNDGIFAYSCYPEFVIGLCESLNILLIKNKIKSMPINICSLYKAYQSILVCNYSLEEIENCYTVISNFLKKDEIVEILKDKEAINTFYYNLKCGDLIGDDFKFFKQSFIDWIQYMIPERWEELKSADYYN